MLSILSNAMSSSYIQAIRTIVLALMLASFCGSSVLAGNLSVVYPEKTKEIGSENRSLDVSKSADPPLHDHCLLLPGLVPYDDEVTVSGIAKFDDLKLAEIEKKCVLLKKDCFGNSLGIYRGRVLLNCLNDVRVVTADASIKVARGSIVYVYTTGQSVLVLNLHDEHGRAVVAEVDGQMIEIPPGRELLLTHHVHLNFDDARLCPGVWYRTVHEIVNKPGLKVYQTQFSTISAAAIFPAVRKLVRENKTCAKLAKTFAAVITVSRDRQNFRAKSSEAGTRMLTLHKR